MPGTSKPLGKCHVKLLRIPHCRPNFALLELNCRFLVLYRLGRPLMIKVLKVLLQILLVVAFLLFGVGLDEQLSGLARSDHRQPA